MTDSDSEFSFISEGSQEYSKTEESKFPQSKRTKKRNFEDKHMISMDKARKARSYWSNFEWTYIWKFLLFFTNLFLKFCYFLFLFNLENSKK